MKLKDFSQSAKSVIDKVCALDSNKPDEELKHSIQAIITNFDKEVHDELLQNKRAKKEWRFKRNELSMFYELINS